MNYRAMVGLSRRMTTFSKSVRFRQNRRPRALFWVAAAAAFSTVSGCATVPSSHGPVHTYEIHTSTAGRVSSKSQSSAPALLKSTGQVVSGSMAVTRTLVHFSPVSISFSSPELGWMIGQGEVKENGQHVMVNQLLLTADGGRHWVPRYQTEGTLSSLFALGFEAWFRQQFVTASGNETSTLVHAQLVSGVGGGTPSTGGGQDAVSTSTPPLPEQPSLASAAMKFMTLTHAPVRGLDFVTSRVGYADSSPREFRNRLLRTVNGGRTWSEIHMPAMVGAGMIVGISFLTSRDGWIFEAGQPGAGQQQKAVYATTDSGRTWAALDNVDLGSSMAAAHAAGVSGGGGAGNATGTTVSGDNLGGLPGSGSTESQESTMSLSGLNLGGYAKGIQFLNRSTGWLWESRGFLMESTNGGRTWHDNALSAHSWFEVMDVSFVNGQDGFALCRDLQDVQNLSYVLEETTNSGRTWRVIRHWPLV
ncbi:MAG: hypothetical protein OWS03_05990 [Alicyclobacillaceae bacterium]|nr:hypothetical protein [Alicyclobacillaceae bacterium]